MSLDVYLRLEMVVPGRNIPFREDGQVKMLTAEEWNERHPGFEPVTAAEADPSLYSANITHNLNTMAREAGLYECLWRPGEISAVDLIEPLTKGLALLKSDP